MVNGERLADNAFLRRAVLALAVIPATDALHEVKLHLFSENSADQMRDSTPLAGTMQLSTATVSVMLPSGFSRGFVRATWTP